MLVSTYRYLGEPVIVAYGHRERPGVVEVDVLLVHSHLTAERDGYALSDVDSGDRVRVFLPEGALLAPAHKRLRSVELPVVPGT